MERGKRRLEGRVIRQRAFRRHVTQDPVTRHEFGTAKSGTVSFSKRQEKREIVGRQFIVGIEERHELTLRHS